MALLTVQYKVSANGFSPGTVIVVEDNEYVRARIGSTFLLLHETVDVVPVPSVPKPKRPRGGRRRPPAAASTVSAPEPAEAPAEED